MPTLDNSLSIPHNYFVSFQDDLIWIKKSLNTVLHFGIMPLLEVNNNLVTLLCMTSVWPLCMVLPKIAVRMTMHLCQSLPFTVLQTVHKHSISLLYLSALCYVPAKSRKRASLVPINALEFGYKINTWISKAYALQALPYWLHLQNIINSHSSSKN